MFLIYVLYICIFWIIDKPLFYRNSLFLSLEIDKTTKTEKWWRWWIAEQLSIYLSYPSVIKDKKEKMNYVSKRCHSTWKPRSNQNRFENVVKISTWNQGKNGRFLKNIFPVFSWILYPAVLYLSLHFRYHQILQMYQVKDWNLYSVTWIGLKPEALS